MTVNRTSGPILAQQDLGRHLIECGHRINRLQRISELDFFQTPASKANRKRTIFENRKEWLADILEDLTRAQGEQSLRGNQWTVQYDHSHSRSHPRGMSNPELANRSGSMLYLYCGMKMTTTSSKTLTVDPTTVFLSWSTLGSGLLFGAAVATWLLELQC
uniref:Uncharacterized protein n=1 Tax=Amphora coffeiformis TaxID=265554 RepID=A0A7S3LG12_9STRA